MNSTIFPPTTALSNISSMSADKLEASLKWDLQFKVVITILFTTAFIIGICGNIMVIYVVFRFPGMQTLTNLYLVSNLVLASSASLGVPEVYFYKYTWIYGTVMSGIVVFAQCLGFTASALTITAVAVKRYIGIFYPLKAKVFCTPKGAKVVMIALWIVSALFN